MDCGNIRFFMLDFIANKARLCEKKLQIKLMIKRLKSNIASPRRNTWLSSFYV